MKLKTEENFLIELPNSFREFLIETNGGAVEKNISTKIEFLGGAEIQYFLRDYSVDDIPTITEFANLGRFTYPYEFLPIAYDYGGGVILIGILGEWRGKIIIRHGYEFNDSTGVSEWEYRVIEDNFSTFFESLESGDEYFFD